MYMVDSAWWYSMIAGYIQIGGRACYVKSNCNNLMQRISYGKVRH